jgi:hypothetical protein
MFERRRAPSRQSAPGPLSDTAVALMRVDHERGLHQRRHTDCPLCKARVMGKTG